MNCDNISSHQHHNGTSVRLFQAIKKLKSSIKGYGVKRKKKRLGLKVIVLTEWQNH